MKHSKKYLTGLLILSTFVFTNCGDSSGDSLIAPEVEQLNKGPEISGTIPVCGTRKYTETHYTGDGSSLYNDDDNPIVCPPNDGGDGFIVISTTSELNRTYVVQVNKWNEASSYWEFFYFKQLYSGNDYFINTIGPFGDMDGQDRFQVLVYEPLLVGGGGSISYQDTIYVKLDLND